MSVPLETAVLEPSPPQEPRHIPLIRILAEGKVPSLVVFDADYTLWPFDCGKDRIPPFFEEQPAPCGPYDQYGRLSAPYIAVPHIVACLVDSGIPIAIASRNPSAVYVSELLRAISIRPGIRRDIRSIWDAIPSAAYFHAYSSAFFGAGKDRHFTSLYAFTGVAYRDMLFFDDQSENIDAARAMGVTSVLVTKEGLTIDAFKEGLAEWRKK